MAIETAGYDYLIGEYHLDARPLAVMARIDTAIKGRKQVQRGGEDILVFEPSYRPAPGMIGHLQFALRYEGVNLEVLSLLFEKIGPEPLNTWLMVSPESAYARRSGFLYEWLIGRELAATVSPKARYVPALDEALQFGFGDGSRNAKFRVIDNLPGTKSFCPLVRKTPYLRDAVAKDLKARTRETLARYDPDLLHRAAAFLYLKETQSSFEVERERPAPGRAQRFADLLRQADTGYPLSEERLVELQNAVVDSRFHEFTWRQRQNWIGQDLGYRKKVDYVPPRPEDVPALMEGLLALAERTRQAGLAGMVGPDAVVLAAAVAFGFVFIHPFMDGNGRLHRYLIHDLLAIAGFTPRGIVLPVSAVILANLSEYVQVLEAFARPLLTHTEYNPDAPDVPATGNEARYYRYFDATPQAEFLYRALFRTVEQDLVEEIDFLLGFDQARQRLNELLDWPPQAADLFIRCVRQNDGLLSRTKRQSYFMWMTDDEVALAEAEVKAAFAMVMGKA